MKQEQASYKAHVFVCTNQKLNKPCCAPHRADEIRAALKEWTREKPEWRKRIRVNASGCLDRCNEGVVIAIYPQNEWILEARLENLEEIKATITRLMDAPENAPENAR